MEAATSGGGGSSSRSSRYSRHDRYADDGSTASSSEGMPRVVCSPSCPAVHAYSGLGRPSCLGFTCAPPATGRNSN